MRPRRRQHTTSVGSGILHRWSSATVAVALILTLCGTVGWADVAASPPPRVGPSEAPCEPRTLVLPGLTSTSDVRVSALSDSGWVAGTSWEDESPSSAVVWTDAARVVDTGVGGITLTNGNTISASAVDVNEGGTVAIDRSESTARGRLLVEDAIIWSRRDGATVLPTSHYRPRASTTAINDDGDVLGHVRGRGHGSVPVIWRDGDRLKLPVPAQLHAYANDINNDGLVVGVYYGDVRGSWTWSGGPKAMALRPTDTTAETEATDVADSGRIVGGQHVGPGDAVRTILWHSPAASPQRLMRIQTVDLHNSGYLAAAEPGFRGYGATAYVGHLRDGGIKARLPEPPPVGDSLGWSNVRAAGVARGFSHFAPQGGVTIGGFAQNLDFTLSQAVLWTCSQAWLDR